jgi:hypothetical protein
MLYYKLQAFFKAIGKNSLMDTYGERLGAALQAKANEPNGKGKDRAWLAKEMGISVQALGQAISGKTKAHTAEHHELAVRALGCNGFWLATGEGQMKAAPSELDQTTKEAVKLMQSMTPGQREGALSTLRTYQQNLAPPHDGQALQVAAK